MEYSKGISLADMKVASNVLKGKIEDCFNINKDNEDFPDIIKKKFEKKFISFQNKYSSQFPNFGETNYELINYQDTLNAKRHGQL